MTVGTRPEKGLTDAARSRNVNTSRNAAMNTATSASEVKRGAHHAPAQKITAHSKEGEGLTGCHTGAR